MAGKSDCVCDITDYHGYYRSPLSLFFWRVMHVEAENMDEVGLEGKVDFAVANSGLVGFLFPVSMYLQKNPSIFNMHRHSNLQQGCINQCEGCSHHPDMS